MEKFSEILVPESEASHQMTFSYNNRQQIHLYSGSFRNHHLCDCYVFFFNLFNFPLVRLNKFPQHSPTIKYTGFDACCF